MKKIVTEDSFGMFPVAHILLYKRLWITLSINTEVEQD